MLTCAESDEAQTDRKLRGRQAAGYTSACSG